MPQNRSSVHDLELLAGQTIGFYGSSAGGAGGVARETLIGDVEIGRGACSGTHESHTFTRVEMHVAQVLTFLTEFLNGECRLYRSQARWSPRSPEDSNSDSHPYRWTFPGGQEAQVLINVL